MFLALHHSACAAIHVLVARVVFLDAAVSFISKISSSDTRGLGPLPWFLSFVEQNEDFTGEKLCSGIAVWSVDVCLRLRLLRSDK